MRYPKDFCKIESNAEVLIELRLLSCCRIIHKITSIVEYIGNLILDFNILPNENANTNDNSQHESIFHHVLTFFTKRNIRSYIVSHTSALP